MTATQPKQRSHAYYEYQITLHSDEAQHAMERMGQIVDDSLRNMRYSLRYAAGDKIMDKVDETVESAFAEITADIAKEIEIFEKVIHDNGIQIVAKFSHPVTTVEEYSTPMTMHYFSIIEQLDKLIQLFEKLWGSKFWNNKQRVEAGRDWQKRVQRLGNEVNKREQRAWAAAARKNRPVQENQGETKKPGDAAPAQVTELAAPATAENTTTVAAAASPPAAEPDTVAPVIPMVATEAPVAADPPQSDSKPVRKKKAVAA